MPKDNTAPAFMFYPDDFSSDGKVESMTTEEVGCYILLLCKAWREKPPGSVPDDDCILARWSRTTSDRWQECRIRVLAAFRLGTDKRWHQSRLRREYEAMQLRRKLKQKAGLKGANVRYGKPLDSTAIAEPEHTHGSRVESGIGSEGSSKERGSGGKRLHRIPANVEEVIAHGASLLPVVSEARCRKFWGYYEGQARTNPNGDIFWVTASEAVVTNWKAKLPDFAIDTPDTKPERKQNIYDCIG